MTPECIITGCRLYVPDEGKSLWGDLWMLRSTYIFNGVLQDGNTAWNYDPIPEEVLEQEKVLTVHLPLTLFERRSVIVVPRDSCTLNQTALDYLIRSAR